MGGLGAARASGRCAALPPLVRSTCWASSRSVSRWASASWYPCYQCSRGAGVGNAEVGAVISAFALMRLISSPFCGWLIESSSERIIMATGIFIVAISSGLAGISRSYLQLLILRGVGGIGSAMFTVSAFTLLLTSVEAGLRVVLPGFFQAEFLIGGITGPAVGGAGGHLAPPPFFFYAGTLVVAGTAGLLLLRRQSAKPERRPHRPCRFASSYVTPVIRRHASATSPRVGPRSGSAPL